MRDKIHILHIKDSYGLYGAERAILTLAKHIDRERFAVTLLCLDGRRGLASDLSREAQKCGIAVERIPVNGRLDLRAIKNIRTVITSYGNAIVHAHDYKSTLYALLASLGLPVKRVATAHGSTRDSLLMKVYLFLDEHIVYRFLDKVVAVGDSVFLDLRDKGVQSKKIVLIRNAVDLSLLNSQPENERSHRELPAATQSKTFAVVGRLFPDKGHRFFLEAFERVSKVEPSIRTLIVGGGPWRDELVRHICRLKLENNVFLCGVRSDMNEIYSRVDFIVIPSLREGLPYVLLEALASRVPVLATAVGDIPRLIEHERTGFLVPPADVAALETYMLRLLRRPDEAKRMAESGWRLVTEQYSPRCMAGATERLYESLASN